LNIDDAVTIAERLEQLGIVAIVLVAIVTLVWALGRARVDKDGTKRSSLLVPGWIHDAMLAAHDRELEAQRQFYAKALADEQERANVRIAEWRGFRDEAIAKAVDADDDRRRLLEAVTNSSRDIGLILELQRMADRDGRGSEPARDR
jgi:hypothetical protein